MSDPFAHLRGREEYSDPMPMDQQTKAQRENTLSQIIDLYRSHAGQKDIPELLGDKQEEWGKICVKALMREDSFCAICLDKAVGLYDQASPGINLKPDWLCGLYLPGFYDHYESFGDGYNAFFQVYQEEIVQAAERKVRRLLQNAEDAFETMPGTSAPASAIALETATPEFATFFQLVKQDKKEDATRNSIHHTLSSLGPEIDQLPDSKALLVSYTAQPSRLIDQFTSAVGNILQSCSGTFEIQPLEELTSAEKEMLARATSTDLVAGKTEQQRRKEAKATAGQQGNEQKYSRRTAEERKRFDILEEPSNLMEWLREYFDAVPAPTTYPCWAPPTDLPFEAKAAYEELDKVQKTEKAKNASSARSAKPNLIKSVLRRSTSYHLGRQHSDRLGQVILPDSILENCIRQTTETFFEEGRQDKFGQEIFLQLADKLGSIAEREPRAVKEPAGSTWQTYSEMGLYDNWFHVRKLLQALDFYLASGEPSFQIIESENRMARLIAAAQGGHANPLPWILAMDGTLRSLWFSCLSVKKAMDEGDTSVYRKMPDISDADRWIRIKNIFEEMAAFAQGAMIYASVLRFRYSRLFRKVMSGPKTGREFTAESAVNRRLFLWYEKLYAHDPTCANPDDNRLLPHPDKFQRRALDGTADVFSVGSRGARVGKKSVRQFVSTNRVDIYPCFVSCIQSCTPNETLIMILFYYSHIFHAKARGCKDARGKRSIVAFG
ncbi:hypothetical protein KC334_g548 [Hortaea werneckii]|nr:hypothetical protein KC334_g548 [Hortaea werneckii]KAI7026765.1 hypothetical protein KC355_g543 [Hortaea werneckii]